MALYHPDGGTPYLQKNGNYLYTRTIYLSDPKTGQTSDVFQARVIVSDSGAIVSFHAAPMPLAPFMGF